jgi:hypothetical protein
MQKKKSTIACIFWLALLLATPAVVQAQTKTTPIIPLTASGCSGTTYEVSPGDRLYNMYGLNWKMLRDSNPGLDRRTTMPASGQEIVMLYPEVRDVLCIPQGMTIAQVIRQSTPASTPSLFPPGCTSAVGFSTTTGQACSGSTPTPLTTSTKASTWYESTWLWLPLLILFLFLGALYAYKRERRFMRERKVADENVAREIAETEAAVARNREMLRDPITSGTPYVPGGIVPTEKARLESFFDDQAATRYSQRNPGNGTVRPVRIGPIEAGTITGEGLVGYLGGEMLPRTITTPIAAYQARYRFPDGTEEILQSLMLCMNPVSHGGDVYRGFVFTLGNIAVPALPVPVAQVVPPQEAAPAPVVEVLPAIAPVSAEPIPVADGGVRIEILPANKEHSARIQMSGVDETGYNSCEIKPNGMVIFRYTSGNCHSNGNVPDVIRQTPLDAIEQSPLEVIEQRQPGALPKVLPQRSKQ